MRATAWNNGSHHASGAGYGLRISEEDRDRYFNRNWQHVVFDLGGEAEATVRLSESFWRSCSELRSAQIGRWFRRNGLAPWPKGDPPAFAIEHVAHNRFVVSLPRR
jgi:hypothetical protein